MTPQLIFLLCDDTPLSRAIVCASAPAELLLDHVGILDMDSRTVIEANAKEGVVETPLADFIDRAPRLTGDPGYRLRRIPPDVPLDYDAAMRRARSFLGCEYNDRFIPTPGALYCSELVQRSFLLPSGLPYFRSIPLNFRCSDPAAESFWTSHYASFHMPIPQGAPGTSPTSIYVQTIRIDNDLND